MMVEPVNHNINRFAFFFLARSVRPVWLWAAVSILSCLTTTANADEPVDFRRDVQPILSDRCFHCHGPDASNQDSEFRMDSKENVFADLGGYAAVVPGDLDASELHLRIHSTDEFDVMPPRDSNRSLSAAEKEILDRWIKQGAPYQGHWAFDVPQRPAIPKSNIENSAWPEETKKRWLRNPIDAFVARRLIEMDLLPSPPAEESTLLRRAALTLTGLLPADDVKNVVDHAEADSIPNDPNGLADPANYELAVDKMLASTAYAEHQTLRWLDAARYADTDGYQNDAARTNWPWRDWVIKAFQQNMPFDDFTIEQLAGDMLPHATDAQRLATAFNRNHRQNAEGGALAEEFAVENIIDRVETTSTVWLGLTMGCCRCHDHKYDPVSQREFYQFYAYFNNIGERGIGRGVDADPTMESYSPLSKVDQERLDAVDAARREVDHAMAGVEQRMQAAFESISKELVSNKVTWRLADIAKATLSGEGDLFVNEDQSVQYSGGNDALDITYEVELLTKPGRLAALRLDALVDSSFGKPRQLAPSSNGNFVLTDFQLQLNGKALKIQSGSATYEQDKFPIAAAFDDQPKSGWAVSGSDVKAETVTATFRLAEAIELAETDQLKVKLDFHSAYANHAMGKFQIQLTGDDPISLPAGNDLPLEVAAVLVKPTKSRTTDEALLVREYYETVDKPLVKATRALKKAEARLREQTGPIASVMVMRESEQIAPSYLLNRGLYNEPVTDEPLSRGVPAALMPLQDAAQPQDRLELARWLVSRENPLTARVAVNRMWQEHFGVGLVKSSGDFGLQGERPSHPDLLDWLAVEFIESGWDVQAMHRLIVTSAAYRQSSRQNKQLNDIDPENRLIARGPRYRADGFTIRDIALQAAGLLSTTAGGPPVKPYQPAGLWESVASRKDLRYRPDTAESLYRKSMYTFWKRAVNPPRQTIFDAGGREVCSVLTRRTNTPLQALVMMNDPTFIEAARKLAERALHSHVTNDQERFKSLYRNAMGREADEPTLLILSENHAFFREHFASQPEAAKQLLSVGESPSDGPFSITEHAALTAVAHLIMNLDEFLNVE